METVNWFQMLETSFHSPINKLIEFAHFIDLSYLHLTRGPLHRGIYP